MNQAHVRQAERARPLREGKRIQPALPSPLDLAFPGRAVHGAGLQTHPHSSPLHFPIEKAINRFDFSGFNPFSFAQAGK